MKDASLYRALLVVVLLLLALRFFGAIRFLLSGMLTIALIAGLAYFAWREFNYWRSR